MLLTPKIRAHIRDHALEFPGKEVCGAIGNDGVPVRWQNHAFNEQTGFLTPSFNPDAMMAIYHSHPEGQSNDFSVKDIKASRALSMPMVLFHVPSENFKVYNPNVIEPYIGREWNWVYRNCYTLMQDYFKQELDVELPDFYLESPRAWLRGKSVGYIENLPKHGFRRIAEGEAIRKHDVILMWKDSTIANHVAIVVDPNQNKIIEHLENMLSHPTVYNGQMLKQTHSVWRWVG